MTTSIHHLSDDLAFDTQYQPEPTIDTNALTIRNDITKVSEAMNEFDKLSAGLDALAKHYPVDLVYDVSTGAGMQEAKDHRAAWREPRLTVERLRKQAKAPVIALGKNIDARAAWLTEQLLIGETPIDQQIKVEEARKEAEKQARVMAELERVQKIEDAIGEIHMDVMVAAGKPSATILATLEALRTQMLDPLVFQDRMPQADAARAAGVAKLEIAYKAKLHDEEEAARLTAERAELAELRAAAAAQKVKDAEAAKIEQARIAAEQAAEAKRLKDAADSLAAQQADIDRQVAEIAERQVAGAMPSFSALIAPIAEAQTPASASSGSEDPARSTSDASAPIVVHADERAADPASMLLIDSLAFVQYAAGTFSDKFPSQPKPSKDWWLGLKARIESLQPELIDAVGPAA